MIKIDKLTDKLNDAQKQAVTAPAEHVLILAGAGSGKTRVLVHRISWLLREHNVSVYEVLAVTFTNKAARQMRLRIEEMQGMPLQGMWVGTFHGLAHRMLRTHWEAAGLPQAFQILDSADQHRLIRRLLKQRGLDESSWPPKQVQSFINKQKESAIRAGAVITQGDIYLETMQAVYADYEKLCQQNGVVDFTELLLRSLELLRKDAQILLEYQTRFKHILVDEFQDTNPIQYQWLSLLAGNNNKVMAVGDDDQSIYSWRGAQVGHILQFQKDYAGCLVIRLEQNYRSTQLILQAANAVIANNTGRMGKNLWTEAELGDKITLYEAFSERDEACYVLQEIIRQRRDGIPYTEMAIVYRSNAQSRILEEVLLREGIPYRIYGGVRFYERAEIKDALAYLRMIVNRDDDAAFERVINLPVRGIGQVSLQRMRDAAKEQQISLWQAAKSLLTAGAYAARAAQAIGGFMGLIEALEQSTAEMPLDEIVAHTLDKTALIAHFEKDRSERGQSKVENLEELLTSTGRYLSEAKVTVDIGAENENGAELSKGKQILLQFLSEVSLESGERQADANSDAVHLMTLHAAKGLEFPVLFMTGVEEGLFPHKMALDEAHGLEEERRLCYVGITRAMQKLYICYAQTRMQYGTEQCHRASRFIKEIPSELLDEVRPVRKVQPLNSGYSSSGKSYGGFNNRNNYKSSFSDAPASRNKSTLPGSMQQVAESPYNIGQKVKHARFGQGVITNYEGQGEQLRLQVKFSQVGSKWLLSRLAKLSLV